MGKRVNLGLALEAVVSAPHKRVVFTTTAYAQVRGRDIPIPAGLEEALHEVLDILHRCADRLSHDADADILPELLDGRPVGVPGWAEHVRFALEELQEEGGDVEAVVAALEKALAEAGLE